MPDGFPFSKGEILCLPYRGTSDFIRLLSFSEKLPVLQFCAYGFPLPVQRCKKHLKPVALFGGLSDTDAAAASFAHENKHPLRCKFPLYRKGIYKRLPGLLPGLAFAFPLQGIPYRLYKFVPLSIQGLHRRSCYSGMPQAAYLSAILDLKGRDIVSFAIGRHNNNQLVFETFTSGVSTS